MTLPESSVGYRVNIDTGTVHKRYADHATGPRTHTEDGVARLLNGRKPQACKQCWPKPTATDPTDPTE